MSKVRVMLVDDSVVIRRMLSDILSQDPDIEVAGTASNGHIAIAKLTQLQPDVVVMDVEMPVMTGLEALPEMRKTHPKLPIIMFSTLTTRGGTATLDALSLGATDYVAKPANVGSVGESIEKIRAELIPKVRTLGGGRRFAQPAPPPLRTLVAPRPRTGTSRVDAVVIGVSTGGPRALQEVIPHLPAGLPVPVLIVQHMPPIFTKLLADRLDQQSPIQVEEASEGRVVEPGLVLIAPGEHHMVVARSGPQVLAHLNQDPPESSCRPAADPLFRSAAQAWGPNVLAVILTGMGQDGYLGCGVVREAGGQVVVQDEATSIVWGMPGAVARAGLAEAQLPVEQVAQEITRRVGAGRPASLSGAPAGARVHG